MSVTVTTPATVTDLTTVFAVKEALGVSSSKFDKIINRLIEAATSAIEEYVGHVYAKQTYLETVAGSDHPMLMLTNVPVIGTPTILTNSEPVVDFVVQDPDAGILYREVGWARVAWVGWGIERSTVPGTEELNFDVTYEAGYVLPGQENPTLPGYIEQACVETVVAWYKSQRRDPAVKSKKVGDTTITYGDVATMGAKGLPAVARSMLSRRIR